MTPTRPSSVGRRGLRRLGSLLMIVALFWLLASLLASYSMTRRARPPFAEPTPTEPDRPWEGHRLQTDDGQEIGAWYLPGPEEGPSVLLLHGRGASRSHWLPVADVFAEQGASVLLISLRAHGDSTGEIDDVGYGARRDVLAAVAFLELRRPGQPIIVQGTSMGAAAALYAAPELAERISGYLLESPYRDIQTAVRNRTRLHLPPVLEALAYYGLRLTAPLFLPEDIERMSPLEHIGHVPVSVPVVILSGTNDRHATPEEAQDLFARVESHGRLVLVEGAGHEIFARRDPVLYRTIVFTLLAQVGARREPRSIQERVSVHP